MAFGLFQGLSQHQISGQVLDAQTQAPLEQVSVYLPQLERGTITDTAGQFQLNDLPSGTYRLVASYLGYRTFSSNLAIGPGATPVEILLEPSAIEMEEVIVSTPFHKLQRENVMKVEQARISELRNQGSITLADGITKIPGVESVSTGMGIGKPVIRGLSANRVLVYSQGVRLENQQFGEEHGLGLNDAGIESVEVIKGPASLLYGSDAMGGVLYLNPEKFAVQNESAADVGARYFGNTRGYSLDAGYKVSGERIKYLIRGAGSSHTDYQGGDGALVTNSRFREYDLKTGLGYQTSRMKTELRYNLNRADLGIPEGELTQSRERSPASPYQEIANHILSSDTDFFFRNSSLQLTLGYVFNNRKEFEEEAGTAPALHMKLSTLNYNLQYHLPQNEKWETIVGVQGMHQKNENFGEELLIPDATTNDLGILATSHLHFKGSDLQVGLRFDHRALKSTAFGDEEQEDFIPGVHTDYTSFNAALGYRADLGKTLIARINLASGFRAPNLAELTSNGTHEGTNRYEIGNSGLANERNIQADLALEYENQHIEAYINGFYNQVGDYIYLEPDGSTIGEDPVFRYRQQDARLYGGEIGVHIHPHPLDWLHIESSLETVRGHSDDGEDLPLIPPPTLNNTLRMETTGPKGVIRKGYAFVGISTTFRQDRVSAFETQTPGYTLLNAGVGGNIQFFGQALELRLTANNLLDKSYISHLSRLKADGLLNIGRNVGLDVRISI